MGCGSVPADHGDPHGHPRARDRAARAPSGPALARPRVWHRRGRRARRRPRRLGDRDRPGPGADRHGARTRRRPRARHRLPGRRLRDARRPRRALRRRVVDLRRDVLAGPRGDRARARPCHRPQRPDRARELDADRRPRADVPDDGPVPARRAAEQPVRLGLRSRASASCWATGSSCTSRSTCRRSRCRPARPTGSCSRPATARRKTLADSLGDRREELHGTWVDFFESNYRQNGSIEHAREYLLVLGIRR